MGHVESYQLFLEELRNEYSLIMEQCAPKISKHFTRMTQVINEGNSYEFPSGDIHRAVLLRLILNDPAFAHLVQHLAKEFDTHHAALVQSHPGFVEAYDLFVQMLAALNKQPVNIDQYMKDLRKHALQEYEELLADEQEAAQRTRVQSTAQ